MTQRQFNSGPKQTFPRSALILSDASTTPRRVVHNFIQKKFDVRHAAVQDFCNIRKHFSTKDQVRPQQPVSFFSGHVLAIPRSYIFSQICYGFPNRLR